MPGAAILSATYGIDVKSIDDPFLEVNLTASRAWAATMVPGKFLADTIPIRGSFQSQTATYRRLTTPWIVRYVPDWFPGTGFKALAHEVRDKFKVSLRGPMEHVKNAMKVSSPNSLRSDRISNPMRNHYSPARGIPTP